MKRQGLPKSQRLRKGPEFSRTLQEGSRLDGEFISAYWILSNDSSSVRVGVAAGKRLGGSVERNRMKRLLREAYRKRKRERCRGLAIVLMASRRALNRSAKEIEEDVAGILLRIEAAQPASACSPSSSEDIEN
jgi:ribonuclease P protein component